MVYEFTFSDSVSLRKFEFPVKNRLKYFLVVSVVSLVRVLPLGFSRKIADGIGWFLNRVAGIRTEVVEKNIREALPDCPQEQVEEYRDQCYKFFSRAAIDWINVDETLRKETIREEGWEHLDQYRGEGAIVVSGHFGFWEIAAIKVARRYDEFTVYADKQSNPYSDRLIKDHREKFGLRPVTGLTGVKELLQKLRSGKFVGAMGDQREGNNYHYVRFFGRAVRTPRIIPFLARRTGSPVIPMSACRKDGYIQFKIHPPLETSLSSMSEGDEMNLLRDYNIWLEEEILKCPGQYFWLHKRWKDSKPLSSLKDDTVSTVKRREGIS